MESIPTPDVPESGNLFCNNPTCDLHVRAGDSNVRGFGNWAVLANGLTVGRGLYDGVFLCDRCGRRGLK
jgi:hypothetical protein